MNNMNTNINLADVKEKLTVFGEKFRSSSSTTMAKVSEKMTVVGNVVGGKMREFFSVPTRADELVAEATAETMGGPDWGMNLEFCDLVNGEKITSQDAVRAIKKRFLVKNPTVLFLTLTLLEAMVKNCDQMFSEVASERVLDELVKLVDDSTVSVENRSRILMMIESWGESTEELRYLPVFEETYKSLKSRGIRFPGRDAESLAPIFTPPTTAASLSATASALGDLSFDSTPHAAAAAAAGVAVPPVDNKETLDVARNSVELLNSVLGTDPKAELLKEELTLTLVRQCQQSQRNVQRMIERSGDDEAFMFEALNIHEQLSAVLKKVEDLKEGEAGKDDAASPPNPATAAALEPPAQGPNSLVLSFDDGPAGAAPNEPTLVRNSSRVSPKTGGGAGARGEDQDIADLDEMIFGKKDGEPASTGDKRPVDLLS